MSLCSNSSSIFSGLFVVLSVFNLVLNSKAYASSLESPVTLQISSTSLSNITREFLTKTYREGYYKTYFKISQKIKKVLIPEHIEQKEAEKIISTSFGTNQQNFKQTSNNIFSYLYNSLDLEIQQALASKKSPKEIKEILITRFSIANNDATRMVRTFRAITSSKATSKTFKDMKVEEYEILATLNDRTREICQEMDRKIFSMKEYQIGVTAPPLHYNCRSTILPKIKVEETSTRIARNEQYKNIHMPEYMTYQEWKKIYKIEK